MGPPLLEIKNLTLQFPNKHTSHTALDNISFSIAAGETLALVGESGSGKTVTSLAIMQILAPNAHIARHSQILLEEKNLLTMPEIQMRKIRGRRIGMIFQEASAAFNPVLKIGEQIDESLKCHFKLSAEARKRRVLNLFAEVGLQDPERCYNSYSHKLSGGQRQRAMIAMALAAEPALLIADEPTTALDVTLQAQIIALLQRIQKNTGCGLLFITHDLGIVKQIANRVAVIAHGKIVERAETAAFFTAPQDPYSQKLFSALPSWKKRLTENNFPIFIDSPILAVKDLKVYYPIKKGILQRTVDYVKAVNGVSFSVVPGQTVAIVGESGCGKTSTAKGILRLEPIAGGEILFLKESIAHLKAHELKKVRGDLQMIFQDPYTSLNPHMRIAEIIAEGMLAQKIEKNFSACQNKIDALLHRVDLDPECKYRYPHEFSGGQRQRICIARALAMQPKLIICDEPTSALDVVVQMDILQLLKSLQKDLDIAYLLITHNIAVVRYLAHQVLVMKNGEVVEQGDVKQILFSPQADYTKKLLAAAPQL